eukprot:SAG11_NODE_1296_length_5271_cov_7.677688_6_plen_183_part_00
MNTSTQTIRAGKNTYYINYTLDANNNINDTTGFNLHFPVGAQNIKANNAFISIDSLMLANYVNGMNNDIPVICVQTGIPTSSCINASENPAPPTTMGYFENIMWDTFFRDDATKNDRQVYIYKNNNSSRKVMCANPLGNSYKMQIFQFNANGSRLISDLPANNVGTIVLTLKVELIEEEIIQ